MHPLKELTPVSVMPTTRRDSEFQETASSLKQIACVRIQPSTNQGYKVEVYYSTASNASSRIPTSTLFPAKASLSPSRLNRVTEGRNPDACIEKSYADFLKLQAQLQHRVHVAHTTIPCAFCSEVSSVSTWGGVRSSPMAMLLMSETELLDTFTTFINELLTLTRARFTLEGRGLCSAQESVPRMLHEFLVEEQCSRVE